MWFWNEHDAVPENSKQKTGRNFVAEDTRSVS